MPHPARLALDQHLAEAGEPVTLRRRIGTSANFVDVVCTAFVRGYAPEQLVGDIAQQDSLVILSPSEIAAADWPGSAGGVAWPQRNDRFIIGGQERNVEAGAPIRIGDEIVRIET